MCSLAVSSFWGPHVPLAHGPSFFKASRGRQATSCSASSPACLLPIYKDPWDDTESAWRILDHLPLLGSAD